MMFPETARANYGCNTMGTTKSPGFLIENLLSQDTKKLLSTGFSPSFMQNNAMADFRLMGLSPGCRNMDLPADSSSRGFPPMGPAFFPGMPFSYLPLMQDPRHFMQNSRMDQSFPQYGFAKSGMNIPVHGMHPFFQTSRPMQHKRKGGQVRFSNDQTLELEKKFKGHKYLTSPQRKKLAKSLTLSERQIKTWFQNRRAKWRRLKHDDDGQTDEPSMERDSSSSAAKTTNSTASSAISKDADAKRSASAASFSDDDEVAEDDLCRSESACSGEEERDAEVENIVDI